MLIRGSTWRLEVDTSFASRRDTSSGGDHPPSRPTPTDSLRQWPGADEPAFLAWRIERKIEVVQYPTRQAQNAW